jgi:excisionase family DNA binding protein
MTSTRRWLRYPQVAERTGLTEVGVRKLVQQKKIPHYKFGRSVRFDADEIDQWIGSGRQPSPASQPVPKAGRDSVYARLGDLLTRLPGATDEETSQVEALLRHALVLLDG